MLRERVRRSSKECRKLIKELDEYKKGEKMDIKAKKTDLESMLADIHESERSENRPLYIPPEGLGPNEYEQRLLKKFKYFLMIETLMNQMDRKCQRLNDRLKNNMDKADMNALGDSVAETMQKINE